MTHPAPIAQFDPNDPAWHATPNERVPYARGVELLRPGSRFNTVSLGNWLTLAEAAGVPAVPATHLGSLTVKNMIDIEESINGDGEGLDMSALVSINNRLAALDFHFMVRSDAVSADEVKSLMAKPIEPGQKRLDVSSSRKPGYVEINGKRYLTVDDTRLSEAVGDWPEADCPIWARPIVPARLIEGEAGSFQAEWRIFIRDGKIQAASTYYPQAPREADEQDYSALRRVLDAAERIVAVITTNGLVPDFPVYDTNLDGFDPSTIAVSIDFIETESGEVLLLEGGPATLEKWGAHPCAFEHEGTSHPIEGIAWGGGVFSPPAVLASLLKQPEPEEDLAP